MSKKIDINKIKLVKVKSSNIAAIGYNPEDKAMIVEFHSSKRYLYSNVPEKVHKKLMGAESIGIEFAESVKGMYSYIQL